MTTVQEARLRAQLVASDHYPGLAAALILALAASWLAQHYGAPVMLFALLLGMAFHFLHEDGRCGPGIDFASRAVLRVGVALLGARVTLAQIESLGFTPVITVVTGVATTILLGWWLARRFGLSGAFGVLSGGAVAICGASAALAIGSILPRNPSNERNTILTVAVVTGLSTVAMVAYPALAVALRLDPVHAGVFLGGTIHDVAQVVGAGYSLSPRTGDIATYVKLLRVATLVPVAGVLALVVKRKFGEAHGAGRGILPGFLIAFAALVVLNSIQAIPRAAVDAAGDVSRWCLVVAIAALGMRTSLKALFATGWRPVALIGIETLWIGGLVLLSVRWFM
jgi:uncharacterized integral membrane protein (TIGR00698 family)